MAFARRGFSSRNDGTDGMARIKHFLNRGLGIEGLDDSASGRVLPFALILVALAVFLRFFFWWYTGRVWEDSLITVLHSENFVKGLGMTHYRTGEPPLHGFTSPLSVLVPLVGDEFRAGFGLFFIRVVSAFAGGLVVLYAMAIALHPKVRLPGPLAILVMGYLSFEHHQILWGMSGMETQIATLVLLMSLYFTIADQPIPLGASLGLCMLARPDFAFWTVIAGLYVLLFDRKHFLKIVAVALAVYLPWIVFTTLYYGSPIPNTIIAKGLGYQLWTGNPNLTWNWIWQKLLAGRLSGGYQVCSIFQPLGPSFAGHGAHYQPLFNDYGLICKAMESLAVIGSLVALWRKQWALLPILFFVLVYSAYYIFLVVVVFSWYVTPLVAMALFLSARGLQSCGRGGPKGRLILAAITLLYMGLFAGFLPKTFATEKRIQEEIENPVRKSIGIYLSQIMKQDESVGCEPLGYIAYYSGRTVYDWPGLASRKVVEYSKTHPAGRSLDQMLDYFRPDFLVLRYCEYANFDKCAWIDNDYQIIASFEAPYDKTRDLFQIEMSVDLGFLVLAKQNWTGFSLGIGAGHAGAYDSIGLHLVRQGYKEQALEFYAKAIAVGPNRPDSYQNMGELLAELGRNAEAIEAFRKAVAIDPGSIKARLPLAINLSRMGRGGDAIHEYQEILRLGTPSTSSAFLHTMLGMELAKLGRIDEALAHVSEAVRIEPRNAMAQAIFGNLLASQGKLAEAAKHFRKALEINPNDKDAQTALERVLADLKGRGKG